jgi:regulator of sigma E protease
MPATSLTVFKKMLADCKEDSVTLSFWRNGELMSLRAYIDSTATLGFIPKTGLAPSDWEPHKFGLLASIPAGLNLAKETLTGYIAQMKLVFTTTEGVKNLGGFASIGNMFAANWDWRAFWLMTAFLAVILAVMNILPIPLLDGGYVLFLIYEIISRRKPSDKFIEVANYIGLALVVALLLYANGNDIYRLFIK